MLLYFHVSCMSLTMLHTDNSRAGETCSSRGGWVKGERRTGVRRIYALAYERWKDPPPSCIARCS